MIEVPPILPCPDCGIGIQPGDGPNGLAFHACGEAEKEASGLPAHTRDIWGVILATARDPGATMDDLIIAEHRAVLAGAASPVEGIGINAQSMGALLNGHAQVKLAGGGTTLDDLLGFHEDDDDDDLEATG